MMDIRRNSSSRPIAETTTCVNLSTASKQSAFAWGKSMNSTSPNRSSSLNISRRLSPEPRRPDISKIDPRTYADIQSHGLASRIVKYHDDSSNSLKRSMSLNNLHSKSNRFPIVHLKKKEFQYKAAKQPVSMTRIPPPDKSYFYGNTLSSLLRSNSVVGLQQSNEDELSCENRPILHPPHTESDTSPTRSVLDALKEISRKRINSDEADSNDVSKKYCSYDVHASPKPVFNSPYLRQFQTHPQFYPSPTLTPQGLKRQRESCKINLTENEFKAASNSDKTDSGIGRQQSQTNSNQYSPEQVSKKRICTYNNDITSSLSSSKPPHTNKRKLFEQQNTQSSPKANGQSSSRPQPSDDVSFKQKEKLSRYQPAELEHIKQLARAMNGKKPNKVTVAPITPLPATPDAGVANKLPGNKKIPSQRSPVMPEVQRYGSVPTIISNRSRDVVRCSSDLPSRQNEVKPQPKLTLFNKSPDDVVVDRSLIDRPASPVDDACAGIQFIKPKKDSFVCSSSSKALIERTKKSKLALMLSGLRGEIYTGLDEDKDTGNVKKDEVDSLKKSNENPVQKAQADEPSSLGVNTRSANTNTATPATQASVSKSSTLLNELKKPVTSVAGSLINFNTPTSKNPLIPASSSSIDQTSKVGQSTFSFGLKPAITTNNNSTLSTIATSTSAPTTSAAVSSASVASSTTTTLVSQSGGFNIDTGGAQPILKATLTTNTTDNQKTTNFTGFNFPTTTVPTTPATTTLNLPSTSFPKPQEGGFDLKPLIANNSTITMGNTSTPVASVNPAVSTIGVASATNKPMFAFGTNSTTTTSQSFNLANTTTSAFSLKPNAPTSDSSTAPSFAFPAKPSSSVMPFGKTVENSNERPATTTTASSTSASQGMFTFGASTTSANTGTISGANDTTKFQSPFGSKGNTNSGFTFNNPSNTLPSLGSAAALPTPFATPTTDTAKPATNVSFGINKPNPVFNFSGPNNNNSPATNSFASVGNAFGSSTNQAQTLGINTGNASILPSQPTATTAPFSFGSGASKPEAPKPSAMFSFGSPSASNAATSNNAKPQTTATASQPFSFGGASNGNISSATNIFADQKSIAAIKPANVASTTGNLFSTNNTAAIKPSFNFSGNNNTVGSNTSLVQNSGQSLFGGNSLANSNTANTTFGGNQSKPFGFGGAPGFANQSALSSNATNNNMNAGTSAPMSNSFSFGGAVNKPAANPTANASPFNFGSNSSTTSNTPVFGQAATVSKPVAFNFTGGNNATVMPSATQLPNIQQQQQHQLQQNSNNLFAPPAGERVTRRAVRRLTKS